MRRSPLAPPWPRSRLAQHARVAARRLLGHILWHEDAATGTTTAGRIVEVEAYRQSDPACHAFAGRTPRNNSLFLPPGHLYVYRSYGLHWCVNITCEAEGTGAAVLIRSLAPTVGQEAMYARRLPTRVASIDALARGPGNVCRAMGINRSHDGADLYDGHTSVRLLPGGRVDDAHVRCGPRIGITRGVDSLWRLWLAGEAAVSSPKAGGAAFTASPSP